MKGRGEPEDFLEKEVHLEWLDNLAREESLEQLVLKAHLGSRGQRVHLDTRDQLVWLVCLAREVSLDQMDLRVTEEILDPQDQKVKVESQENEVQWELLAHLAPLEKLEVLVILDHLELQEKWEPLE